MNRATTDDILQDLYRAWNDLVDAEESARVAGDAYAALQDAATERRKAYKMAHARLFDIFRATREKE